MEYLAQFLNRLYQEYHRYDLLQSDPLEFPHRYSEPSDQEAVALVSALLAYGNVVQIRKSVSKVLSGIHQLADSPSEFVRNLEDSKFRRRAYNKFQTFVHRFNRGSDIVDLYCLLSRSWKEYESLGAHFNSYLSPSDLNIEPALTRLIAQWRKWASGSNEIGSGLSFLLSSPADGSCCKRWCMLLRWMGRGGPNHPGEILDLGLWTGKGYLLRADQLIMPLDTHTARISGYLGLTSRKNANWSMALEVTARLKMMDPNDPTRYDFALSRLGILDLCKRSYREEICRQCQLLPVCRFAKKYLNGVSLSMRA